MKKVPGYKHLSRRGMGGTYYYRRNVPLRARYAFDGRHEDVASLETDNILEARYRLLDRETLFEAKLRKIDLALRAGIKIGQKHTPSPEEIEAEVRVYFSERRNRTFSDRYFEPGLKAQAKDHIDNLKVFIADTQHSISLSTDGPTLTTEWTAEAVVARCNWDIERDTIAYRKLMNLIARSQIEASQREIQDISGQPIQVIDETFSEQRFDADEERARKLANTDPIPLMDIFDAYIAERNPRFRTARAWRRLLGKFIAFIGHDDAKRIRQADVIAWKDHLLIDRGLSAVTINDAYLAALKTALNWAVDNGRITNCFFLNSFAKLSSNQVLHRQI